MAKPSDKTVPRPKTHHMRKLAGQALVTGAAYAGNRMMEDDAPPARPKKSHKMRNLVGLAVVVGAAYTAEKIRESRKNKKKLNVKKSIK